MGGYNPMKFRSDDKATMPHVSFGRLVYFYSIDERPRKWEMLHVQEKVVDGREVRRAALSGYVHAQASPSLAQGRTTPLCRAGRRAS